MAVETVELVLTPAEAGDEKIWAAKVSKKLRVKQERVFGIRLLKRSLDARKRPVLFRLRFEVGLDEDLPVEPELAWGAPGLPGGAEDCLLYTSPSPRDRG